MARNRGRGSLFMRVKVEGNVEANIEVCQIIILVLKRCFAQAKLLRAIELISLVLLRSQ